MNSLIPNVVLNAALKNDNLLNIVHINSRSLFKKMDDIKTIILRTKVHILMISETWLNSYHHDNIVTIDGYKFFRHDRVKKSHHGEVIRFGGVGIFVKNGLRFLILKFSVENDGIDYIFS